MAFLLGIGKNAHVLPLISIEDYFDRFVDMMLGIGVAFELPVLIFFLTLTSRGLAGLSAASFALCDSGDRNLWRRSSRLLPTCSI